MVVARRATIRVGALRTSKPGAVFWRSDKPNAANTVDSESDDDGQNGAADGFAPHRSRTPEEDALFFTPTPSAARAVANARFASRNLNFAYLATQIVVVQLGALRPAARHASPLNQPAVRHRQRRRLRLSSCKSSQIDSRRRVHCFAFIKWTCC